MRNLFLFLLCLLAFGCAPRFDARLVTPGVEVLVNHYGERLSGKRVGIVTNPTGVDRTLVSTIDLVRALPGVQVVRLFSPEHGLRGAYAAGQQVNESRDPISGLPIVSLYGDSRRPPPEALKGLDVMIYDIQDVGHRTYTFVSTLTYVMEACEKAGVELWVLDRPEPTGGMSVGGPMLDPQNHSFIGIFNVPQVYGLTPGEWARLVKTEHTPRLKLTVVPMRGWKRGMTYGDLGWVWVSPSEHIPRWETCYFYAMTGTLGELGILSEGVGTPLPFEQIGAPWVDGPRLAQVLNDQKLPGVRFRPTFFRPRYGSYSGQVCNGVQIHLLAPRLCDPALVSGRIMEVLSTLYPARGLFKPARTDAYQMFVKSLGDNGFLRALARGGPFTEEEARMERQREDYKARIEKILIYH